MPLNSIIRNLLFSRWYEHIPILYRWYELSMKREITKGQIPVHVAIIMDGNRRYARRMGEMVEKGHQYGADTIEKVVRWCEELDVKQLTLYSFSTENFKRPENEKKAIFDIGKHYIKRLRESSETHENGLHITCVGDIGMLPEDLQKEIHETHEVTSGYDHFYLNMAVAYGGRKEIVDGATKMAEKVKAGELRPEDITEQTLDEYLYFGTRQKSKVDLIIRTGGDERTSNFLPWQASGNECAIYISAPYWPEFRKIDFFRAIRAYQNRERDHRVKYALRIIKIKKQAGKVKPEDIAESLKVKLSLSDAEAHTILKDPHVAYALKSAAE